MVKNEEINTIQYYSLKAVDGDKLKRLLRNTVNALSEKEFSSDDGLTRFVTDVLDTKSLAELLIHVSQLPVFNEEFSQCLAYDLDILALMKKFKYYNNLPLSQILCLVQQLLEKSKAFNSSFDKSFSKLVKSSDDFFTLKFKDFCNEATTELSTGFLYKENQTNLETIDPHAVYPTSIYRHCNGLTLAAADSKTIEAVMSTSLTTSIKITNKV